MKNSMIAAAFMFALALPSVATAENAPKHQVKKSTIDTMTTQAISDQTAIACAEVDGFPLKNNRCAEGSQYPDNAFSGMNLGH